MAIFGRSGGAPEAGEGWEPDAATARLASTAGAAPGAIFTSDLSVSEYVLLNEAGFEPLGFVVGSSIYHIGVQIARWGQNQELTVLTQAMYSARELAMGRMQAEADRLGADGVVGVNLRAQSYVWGQGVLEFIATGTAVRALSGQGAHRAPGGRAFSSDLSAQDFYRLLAAGSVPVAFVLGTCVYHIAHQSAMQSLRQAGTNQEMVVFTQGIYQARELSLARMQAEATQAGGSGIVGVSVAVHNHVWGEHATEFFATGTAIRQLDPSHHMPDSAPKPTFTLGLDV
ncbi:MAG: heavy metal-binding domain-containing protein [Actinomycetota bacterium]|nr:heavy metal-binding domain-containing protein [Actinomycetota bacterium]